MFFSKKDPELSAELSFWNKAADIKIKPVYDFKLQNSFTTDEFQTLLSKHFNSKDLTFYIDKFNKLVVIDTKKHSEFFTIYGHMAGDIYGGYEVYFKPDILNTEHGSYYGKTFLGHLRDYTFTYGDLFIINEASLIKYSESGSLIWESSLIIDGGRQTTQSLHFNHTHRYPNKSYPNNLIAISSSFNLFYYYMDSGKFFGERTLSVL